MLVVFDMDGTLIDTHGMIAEHMTTTFAEAGLHIPEASAMRRIIGLSLPVAIGRLAESDDQAQVLTLVERYKAHYRASLTEAQHREPLFPGAREALDRLRLMEETQLGIATGKGLAGVNRILDLHGLSAHFATLQTPDHNPSKPHPGMLLRAMAETGRRPHEVVMIGDTTFDIELARAADVSSIGVGWGYHEREELLEAGADILIESYDELDDAIVQLLD